MADCPFIDDLAARNGSESAAQRQVAMGQIGLVVLHSLCQYLVQWDAAAQACQRGIVPVIARVASLPAVCVARPWVLLVPP